MSSFIDRVEQVVERRSAIDYRRGVTDPESVSMWQSLSDKPNSKAASCLTVCPAGLGTAGIVTPAFWSAMATK